MKRCSLILAALAATLASAGAQVSPSAPVGPAAGAQVAIGPINVQAAPFNARGDTLTFTDGAIAPGSNILTSASHVCSGLDVGKPIILHGSGAAGVPQQGTILSCSGANMALSFNATLATPWNGAWSASVATPQSGAGSYAPGDTLTCAGGSGVITNCAFSITSTQVQSAVVAAGGSGGTNGAQTVSGTTGTGAKFQASVTVSGGAITAVLSISLPGAYTANPTTLTAEPVTGAGLSGATLNIKMGALALTGTTPGDATTWPSLNTPTTSGSGTGATINLVRYQVGGNYTFGTDDAPALTAAAAAATAAGAQLYLPRGAYWLTSQSACIPLHNVTVSGDGWPQDNGTGTQQFPGGTTIALSNATTSAFCDMSSVSIRDLALYYPLQDGSQATPLAYPPTFESATWVNNTFTHVRVLNAYQLVKVDAGGSFGRFFFDNNLAYCIDECFWLQSGAADTLQLGATNYFGPGAFGATAIAGPAMLQRYTAANAEIVRVDLASATYKQMDGFLATGGIVQGYRYFLRVLGGLVDVSNFGNMNFDAVATLLSVEGTASVKSTTFTAGEAYSTNIFVPAQNACAFNITSTSGGTDLKIGGGFFGAFAQGSWVCDTASGLASLDVSGARFDNFGFSTTVGNYGAIFLTSSNAQIHIAANRIGCSGSNGTYGFLFQGFLVGNVISNTLSNCTYGVVDGRASGAGAVTLFGNNTYLVGNSLIGPSSTAQLIDGGNAWNNPVAPTLTSGWGAGATLETGSNDNFSRVKIGSSPSTTMVMTLAWPKNLRNPFCSAVDETSGVNLVAYATSAQSVTVKGTVAASDNVALRCTQI